MLDWLFGRKKEEPQAPPKKKKPSAEQQAEDKWKYEFIVQFLSGPLWKTSILDFVDYHCVVFDNEEENKFQYTTLHNQFKQLVATLFDGMMQEVGLDDEKLAQLLEKGFESKHKKIFNQLLLAEDFLKFKQLMVNRNKTLEAQAVKALHESQVHKESKEPKKAQKQAGKKLITEQQILRQSKRAEEQRLRKIQQQQQQQLRKVLQLSKLQSQEQAMIRKLQEKVEKREIEHQKPPEPVYNPPQQNKVIQPVIQKQAPKIPQYSAPSKPIPKVQQAPVAYVLPPPPVQPQSKPRPKKNLPSLEGLPPLKNPKKIEEAPQFEPPKQQLPPLPVPVAVVEQKVVQAEKTQVQSQEDRKKRLLEQRERIRKKKEEERKKQMMEQEKAQTQTIVLQEDGIHETHVAAVQQNKVSNNELERRRQLMKKIKNRIVDDL